MAFRKKIERPKNYLGNILYRFDNIYNKDLKSIIKDISSKKKLNLKKGVKRLKNGWLLLFRILSVLKKVMFQK